VTRNAVIACSVATGVALELGIHLLTGRNEAWDASQFWTLGLPAAMAASAAIGFLSNNKDWRWTALVAPGQVATMMVRGGEIGTLFPLTIALSTILSAPFFFAAFVGSRFRK
jgi:hypothetical protein